MAFAACVLRSDSRFALNVDAKFNGAAVNRASHITWLRTATLVAGSGRRYTEYAVCPVDAFAVAAHPYGSCATAIVNCTPAGSASAMRINPLFSIKLWPALSPVAAAGQFAPSTARNKGSLPLLAVNRACTLAALNPIPWLNWWQLLQVRAFVPRA